MKLNRKGYMLVEIIIASVIAMSVSYYLLNLTYKFKNLSTDITNDYFYTNDKILITKNIMNDLENSTITSLTTTKKTIDFTIITKSKTHEKRRLIIEESDSITTIKYGKINNLGNLDINDISYYEKKLEKSLKVGDIILNNNNNLITINIPITTIHNDKDYSIKLYTKTIN